MLFRSGSTHGCRSLGAVSLGTPAGDGGVGEQPERARTTRGMFLHATLDPYVGAARGTRDLAATMGAEVGELVGLGHWWMLEDPRAAADVLEEWITREGRQASR